MEDKKDVTQTQENDTDKILRKEEQRMLELAGNNKKIITDDLGKEYELRPVSLKNLPTLIKLIDSLKGMNEAELIKEPEKYIGSIVQIIKMGLKKYNLEDDYIQENFSLDSFMAVVQNTTEVNGFFGQRTRTMS